MDETKTYTAEELQAMTKAELRAVAAQLGISEDSLPSNLTKAELLAKVQEALTPSGDETGAPDTGAADTGAADTGATPETPATTPAATTKKATTTTASKTSTTTKTATSSLESVGKKILAAHPKQAEVFVISNGRCFFNQADAANAARGLTNKTVTTVKR